MHRLRFTFLVSTGLMLVLCDTAATQQLRRAERLVGANENPPVETVARGNFRARLFPDRIEFRLAYSGIESDLLEAHLHAGNPGTNGGIVVFLCTNLGNTPPGATARPCPPSPAVVTGDIVAADVIGGVAPGLQAGDLTGLRRLISQGAIYANVHSDVFQSGEVRGQLNPRIR